MFDRLCIVGVGLLGGAIGRAARAAGAARRVVGVVRRAQTIRQAYEMVRPGGAILQYGIGPAEVDGVPVQTFYFKDITVKRR